MVFLTSPNNPDGSVIAEADLLALLALPALVVLDEAYIVSGSFWPCMLHKCSSLHTSQRVILFEVEESHESDRTCLSSQIFSPREGATPAHPFIHAFLPTAFSCDG